MPTIGFKNNNSKLAKKLEQYTKKSRIMSKKIQNIKAKQEVNTQTDQDIISKKLIRR